MVTCVVLGLGTFGTLSDPIVTPIVSPGFVNMHAGDTIGVTIGSKSVPKVPKQGDHEVTTKVTTKVPDTFGSLLGHMAGNNKNANSAGAPGSPRTLCKSAPASR